MKKPLQKAIVEWYRNEHNSLNQIKPLGLYECFVVETYIDVLKSEGIDTPSVLKQLQTLRDFISDYYEYINQSMVKIDIVMGQSPFNSDYFNMTNFEKVLSIYNSFCQLEKAAPNSGYDTIKEYYKNKTKL